MMSESDRLDIEAIMRQLPHRYPFLLVDRVLECVAGQHCVALKNVTVNEPFFQGHFPHRPVMPGVLIVEALAQAAGILAFKTAKVVPDINTRFYFVAIDNARFRKPVMPGDQLMLRVTLKRAFKGIWKFHCLAEVDGKEVASAEIMVAPETKAASRAGAADDRFAGGDIAASTARRGRPSGTLYRDRRRRCHRTSNLDRAARRHQRTHAHRRRQ